MVRCIKQVGCNWNVTTNTSIPRRDWWRGRGPICVGDPSFFAKTVSIGIWAADILTSLLKHKCFTARLIGVSHSSGAFLRLNHDKGRFFFEFFMMWMRRRRRRTTMVLLKRSSLNRKCEDRFWKVTRGSQATESPPSTQISRIWKLSAYYRGKAKMLVLKKVLKRKGSLSKKTEL